MLAYWNMESNCILHCVLSIGSYLQELCFGQLLKRMSPQSFFARCEDSTCWKVG